MDSEILQSNALKVLIQNSSIFSHLDVPGQQRLLDSGSLETFESGVTVVKEGDPGDSFYFVKTGSVEVFTNKDGQPFVLAALAVGEVFGEVSVVTAQPRTATVVATEPTELLCFDRRKVSRILMVYPEVTKSLTATINERADDTIKKTVR